MNQKFKQLVKLFQSLPGVGPRQATRFVIALLERPEENLGELGESISNLKRDVGFCGECFNISDPSAQTGNSHCHICYDTKRDKGEIMVVEKVTDLESIEKTGLYKGLYHVLGGAINPLDKITPASLRMKELENRLDKLSINSKVELIIATNPNAPGETTALYLRDLFTNKKGVSITRLGRGLASGSNLEYADEITLKNALDYRK
ncbi:MAG: recombination protein RecR [Candidatus Yanofskybacteria bacterium RIFCSPHIGHO2_02_FULL_43_22]|uniref:Recombination protein RecR n=1 Tax=Candidatus Yanofskybacteria bacterium RIFCSPHIGHO2_02_FULL_43_22 TaxID=1802681 RepID=A0A1F8FRW8_9BACT|nr:MAG: recombination protein RecR [Candidatus Yanofskybacteria bacterium RIFCSPHIGHO2_02_FULL_43_22]